MKKMLLLYYASKITKEDILNYAKKENINLTSEEVNIIYNAIKNDTNEILNNFDNYIIKYKNILRNEIYNKILELKEQYKNFIE